VLAAVLAVARAAELVTIAVGTETGAKLALARELDCDARQGFLLAPPAPADEIATWLASRKR